MVRLLMTSGMEPNNLLSSRFIFTILLSIPNCSWIVPMMLFPVRKRAWKFSILEMDSGIPLVRLLLENLK
jgi:hypothetical protein